MRLSYNTAIHLPSPHSGLVRMGGSTIKKAACKHPHPDIKRTIHLQFTLTNITGVITINQKFS